MATDPLTAAILQGLDPGVYRPLSDISQGNALQAIGQDASPTSKWGALGRLANAAAGSYLANSATSELAKTIAGGKKSAQDQLLAAIEAQQAPKAAPVPSAPPAQAAPPTAPAQPAVQPSVPVAPGSPNAQVANRFPADWSPGTAASPLPNDAPSPLDTAQYPAGPNASAPTVAANAPRGIRNNNPLNIEAGDFTKGQPGFAGSDGRFAKFDTAENGIAAAHKLLDVYDTKHGLNTVNGIIGRWAPSADGNNVSAYAADVAGKLGIDPNAPIPPEKRAALVAAMAQHENGVPVPGADQAPYKVAGPAVAAPRGAAKADDEEGPATAVATPAKSDGLDTHKLLAVLQNPYSDEATKQLAQKLLLEKLTPKEDEFASSPQGIYNKRTGELKQGNGADKLGGLQGPARLDALKEIDPARASQAQAVLEGRVPYPTGSRLNPQQQQLKEDVTQIKPDFSAAKWLEVSNFQKSMGGTAPGTFGGQVRSAGTVAKHLGDALDAIPSIEKGALGASDTLPALNGVKGFIRDQTGDREYQDARGHFEAARKGLSDEVETLLAGGHGAEGSKLYWLDRLDLSKHSPTEVRGALDEFRSLMNGRISNVAQEKDRVFGNEPGHTDPLTLFGPHEREIMERVQKGTYGGQQKEKVTAASAAAPAAGGPDRAAIEAEMRKRGLLK